MFIACDNYKEYRAERERRNKEKAEEMLRRREKERIEKEERSKTLIGGYIDKEGIYHFSFHENMNIEDFEDIEFVTLYDYNQQKYSKICDVCFEMKDFYEDEIVFEHLAAKRILYEN